MPCTGDPHSRELGAEVLKGVPVLVVEDAWHVARAIRSILEQLEMDVMGPTASTPEARRLVAKQRPQIALVDINLKQEMAYDLIEELHGQGVQVIIVSGYAVPLASMPKIAGFLQKPFNGRELIAAMCAALARHH
jgi:DNA-binding response OmpR family regulator